jgi:hypothetical protein
MRSPSSIGQSPRLLNNIPDTPLAYVRALTVPPHQKHNIAAVVFANEHRISGFAPKLDLTI